MGLLQDLEVAPRPVIQLSHHWVFPEMQVYFDVTVMPLLRALEHARGVDANPVHTGDGLEDSTQDSLTASHRNTVPLLGARTFRVEEDVASSADYPACFWFGHVDPSTC